jgi:serine/threonine protein kinase/Tfp pilus assembly protein PilF
MIGQTISHYKILDKLGEGGMGVVYKAHDTKLDRDVALKFLPHHLSANDAEKARFLQEAKAAAALNHPNVCSVIDIQEADGEQFIIMEYVEGPTLRQKLPVPKIEDVIRYAIQIGEALQAAHSKGIVHRDIKSENIMLTAEGRIKVMDFGLAKLKGSLKLTKTSSTVGTLAYMAPEQLHGGEADTRSDIFSFGVVLFELLTGKLPFRGEHEAALMYSIVNEEPESVCKYRQEVSPELDRIIHRALEKDPAERYQHVDDLVSELRRLQKVSKRVALPEQVGKTISPITTDNQAFSQKKSKHVPWIIAGSIVALVAVASYVISTFRGVAVDSRIESIAVLPFRNASGDPSVDYLSDGITENIINSLSRLQKLRVIPRSTAFHYRGKEDEAQKIGSELQVRVVLTGRVILQGYDLNIQTELIDIDRQSQLWGEQYSRKKSDLLTVQDEISRAIASQLHLTGDEGRALIKHSTENTDAYQLYLKGRYYWDKRTVAGFNKALQYFQQALDIDPNYALAYSGIADCYDLLGLGIYNGLPPTESLPKAKAAIEKAFQLDNNLAEAYTTRAHINQSFEWEWSRVESDYRRAIELNPKYATAHVFYAAYLNAMGKFDEALEQYQLAQQLEPLSLAINTWYGMSFYYRREYDAAINQYRKTIDIDPSFGNAHLMLGWAYTAKGMLPEAVAEFRLGRQVTSDNPVMIAALVYALARGGEPTKAHALLDTLLAMSNQRFVSPHNLAIAYAGIGDKEHFYQWLERAIDGHSFIVNVNVLRLDPIFDFVRKESRFVTLFKKTGLPPL